EWLRVNGRSPQRYIRLYTEAIEGAQAAGYTSVEAAAAEGLGRGLLAQGKGPLALGPLLIARRAYERWGIRAKVKSIEALYAEVTRFSAPRTPARGGSTLET